MKYRILSNEELSEMEMELKRFLVSQDISSVEWERINKETPDEALKHIEIFSDMVIDKALQSITVLEHRTPSDLKIFKCNSEDILLVALKTKNPEIDLTNNESLSQALSDPNSDLEIFSAQKKYTDGDREAEIYKMTNQGCAISSEERWEFFKSLVK